MDGPDGADIVSSCGIICADWCGIGLRMKIVLKDATAGSYYAGEDRWVADPVQAMSFDAVEKAGEKGLDCQGRETSVVLRYEDPLCELALSPALCVPRRGAPRN